MTTNLRSDIFGVELFGDFSWFVKFHRMISLQILIVIVIVAVTVAQFDHQYIGNSISLNETKTREYCEQKFCLIDADFLFYAATQNSSIGEFHDLIGL